MKFRWPWRKEPDHAFTSDPRPLTGIEKHALAQADKRARFWKFVNGTGEAAMEYGYRKFHTCESCGHFEDKRATSLTGVHGMSSSIYTPAFIKQQAALNRQQRLMAQTGAGLGGLAAGLGAALGEPWRKP